MTKLKRTEPSVEGEAVHNPGTSAKEIVKRIVFEMKAHFFELDEFIDGLFISLLAEQNVLVVGPPGTAKTQASTFIAKAIGGEFFDHLMTKFTVPDEVVGAVDIVALKEQKIFKRAVQGTLVTAHIALLDEIWKSSSAIVNTLLKILNERKFKENGKYTKVPLKMAIGASNEYPSGDETGAIFDRFNVKFEVNYIEERDNFLKMLAAPDKDPEPSVILPSSELEKLIQEAEAMVVPKSIMDILADMKEALKVAGIIISTRRWKKSIRLIKASALFYGRTQVEEDDMAFLTNVLWNLPEQRSVVKKLIISTVNPINQKAAEIMDSANESRNAWRQNPQMGVLWEARDNFVRMRGELKQLLEQAKGAGKSTSKIEEITEKIKSYQIEVVEKAQGINEE
jgi:MoxR-like ATPase